MEMGRAAMPVQLVRIKVQNTMENIEKIVSHYRRYQAGCAKRRAQIDGEIAKLQEERKHLNELRWTEGLIRPVMAEIAHLTPEIEWEQDKEYHPMGLRCAVPVFGRLKSSSQLLGITFTELGGELFFDTERSHARFAPGTLREINGMNTLSASVGNGEPLLRYIRQWVIFLEQHPEMGK